MKLLDRFRRRNARMNEAVFGDRASSYLPFLRHLDEHLPGSRRVLDLGTGDFSWRDRCPRLDTRSCLVISSDLSWERIERYRHRRWVALDASRLPFKDESVNLVVASYLFEHLRNPGPILSESHRVLKKGGALIFITPNRNSYIGAIARCSPHRFHRWIRSLQAGHKIGEDAVCETLYRANTLSDLRALRGAFQIHLLDVVVGSPSYTTYLPPPLHFPFILLHKLIDRYNGLRLRFGETIVGCWVKGAP